MKETKIAKENSLKTLKDLKFIDGLVIRWELKEEAIKWVKKFGAKDMWEFICFFNITEEDLQ